MCSPISVGGKQPRQRHGQSGASWPRRGCPLHDAAWDRIHSCMLAAIGRSTLLEMALPTKGETMEVNGIAHVFLTASNFERSRAFYRQLLPFLGLKPVMDTETTYYCVGGRTAVGIRAPSSFILRSPGRIRAAAGTNWCCRMGVRCSRWCISGRGMRWRSGHWSRFRCPNGRGLP